MCMIDYDGDELALLASKTPVAAKPHRCGECDRQIGKGEKYHYDAGVVGRDFAAYRTCAHCHAARGWLADRCHWRDGLLLSKRVRGRVVRGDWVAFFILLPIGALIVLWVDYHADSLLQTLHVAAWVSLVLWLLS